MNLKFRFFLEMVYRVFNEYGPIRSVRIIEDMMTKESKGYAFVEYEHEKDCLKAYKVLGIPPRQWLLMTNSIESM